MPKRPHQYGNPWWTWVLAGGLFGLVVGCLELPPCGSGVFESEISLHLMWLSLWLMQQTLGSHCSQQDILIYNEPSNKVFAQGVVTQPANGLTIAVPESCTIAYAYSDKEW